MALQGTHPQSCESLGQQDAKLTTPDLSCGPSWPHMLVWNVRLLGLPRYPRCRRVSGSHDRPSLIYAGQWCRVILVCPVAQMECAMEQQVCMQHSGILPHSESAREHHEPSPPQQQAPHTWRNFPVGSTIIRNGARGLLVCLRPALPPHLTPVLVRMFGVCQCTAAVKWPLRSPAGVSLLGGS